MAHLVRSRMHGMAAAQAARSGAAILKPIAPFGARRSFP